MSRAKTATAAETAATVDRILSRLAEITAQLEQLEEVRADIVLDGGDLDAFHDRMNRLEQEERSLDAALEVARAAHEAALEAEKERALEAEATAMRDEQAPALTNALLDTAVAMAELADAGSRAEAATRMIEHFNDRARRHRREDLVVSVAEIRAAAQAALGGHNDTAATPAPVERQGENDEAFYGRVRAKLEERAKARPGPRETLPSFLNREPGADYARRAFVERRDGEDEVAYEARLLASIAQHFHVSPFLDMAGTMEQSLEESSEAYRKRVWDVVAKRLRVKREGERDEAFARRQLRAHTKAAAQNSASDPLALLAEQAIEAAQRHGLGMDAVQIKRAFPKPISARSLYGRNVNTDPAVLLLYGQRHVQPIRHRNDLTSGS